MASDSDNDFEDTFVPQSTDNNNPPINVTHGQVNSDGKTVRGKDLIWKDFDQFDSAEDFNSSDLRKKMSESQTKAGNQRKFENLKI